MKRNYTKTLCGIIILAILCTLIVACENVQKNVNEASIKDGIAKTFAMVSLQNDNKLNSDS